MNGPTLYDILGVDSSASHETIKRAYRDRARTSHPDVGGSGCTAGMAAVNFAWETLSDTARRTAYDATLSPLRAPAPTHESGAEWVPEPTMRRLRGLVVVAAMLFAVVSVVFTVIAFAQSGSL